MKTEFVKYILDKHTVYPNIPILDIVYYALKGFGMNFSDSETTRPKIHIADEKSLFSLVPLMSSNDASISVDDPGQLNHLAAMLNLKVKLYPRIKSKISYFYLRCDEENVQTLGSQKILNTNFNPKCSGCEFCSRGFDGYASTTLPIINIKKGFNLLEDANVNFVDLSEIAIVTGMFPTEAKLVRHIEEMVKMAGARGFSGNIFYLGCQLVTRNHIETVMEIVERYGCKFRYAYTVELFSGNCNMHNNKIKSCTQALDNLHILKDLGVNNLQFTYMPGLEGIETFFDSAPKFVGIATPHMSVFRPAVKSQQELKTKDFVTDPVEYLCEMRTCVENLWGGPILGNNLGNLWSFPLNQIHKKFSIFGKTNDQ